MRLLTLAAALGGGLVLAVGYSCWPLAIVGVALGYAAWSVGSARWAALTGLVWGLSFFLVHIRWADVAAGVVPWLALSLAEALFAAAAAVAWVWVRRARWARSWLVRAVSFAVVFAAFEQVRGVWPFGGFPWGELAFSQVDGPVGRLAWLGGETLVSFAVALVAGVAVEAARAAWGRRLWRTGLAMAAAAVVVAAPLAIQLDNDAEAGTLRVGAVQGNVAEPGLGSFENRGEVLGNHVRGTYALADQVNPGDLDVVLWPENGSDLDPQTNPDVASEIDGAAKAIDAPILVGSQEFPTTGGRYNVLLLWEPGVGVVDKYAKQHPAPFAEYVPGRSFARLFSKKVDEVATDMLPGHKVGTIDLPVARLGRTVTLGTAICFEVAYEPLVYGSVRAGAQILVVPTNNATFGYTPESTQQLAMTRLRAIETGRAAVQVSTVGVSAVVRPDGAVTQQTKLFTAAQMVAQLPLRTSMTPAMRVGAWPTWITLGAALAMLAAALVDGYIRRRRATHDDAPGTDVPGADHEVSGAATQLSGPQ